MLQSKETTDLKHMVVSSVRPFRKFVKRSKLQNARVPATCLFPTYEKCQTLLLFPNSFASCLNSGDFGSLSRLIKSRIDRHCHIEVFGQKMDVDTVVRVFELQDELHPDSVTTCCSTKAIRNEVRSLLTFKYTSNKTIEASLQRSVQDLSVLRMCPTPHTDPVCLHQFIATKPVEDRLALLTLVYTAEELVIQGKARMTLVIDDTTKKITHFTIACQFTSFEAV